MARCAQAGNSTRRLGSLSGDPGAWFAGLAVPIPKCEWLLVPRGIRYGRRDSGVGESAAYASNVRPHRPGAGMAVEIAVWGRGMARHHSTIGRSQLRPTHLDFRVGRYRFGADAAPTVNGSEYDGVAILRCTWSNVSTSNALPILLPPKSSSVEITSIL